MSAQSAESILKGAESILKDREARYGGFENVAQLSQDSVDVFRKHPGWVNLRPHHREALEMGLHKLARIVAGGPDQTDSWIDAGNYLHLGAREVPEFPGLDDAPLKGCPD